MSSVYLAEQTSFGRLVALKVLTANRAETEHFGRRFLREARIAAHLTHPNIVQVFDTGSVDGNYYLAMEYLPGGDLKERLKTGIPLLETLEIVKSIADAIDYASEQGVIHRDIKPANIMFRSDGSVCLVDFGIARDLTADTEVTQAGAVLGTPRYMSPEQALGKDLDLRSDLYSLGVVFYELLSGTAPFTANSAAAVGLQHVSAEVPPLPVEMCLFQEVVDTVLEKEPAYRYESGMHLIWAIDQIRQVMPEELSTTILQSQPHAELGDSLASGMSGTRSRRRKNATRRAAAQELRFKRLRQLSVALICTMLVVGGVLVLFPYLETGDRADATDSQLSLESEQQVDALSKSEADKRAREQMRNNMAAQTLEQAQIALEEGRIESAEALINLVTNIGSLSPELQVELARVIGLREQAMEKEALTESLAIEVGQMIAQSAYLMPRQANAFHALARLREVAPGYRELGSLERRITSAASLKIQDRIDRGLLSEADKLITELERFVSVEVSNPLRESLEVAQSQINSKRSRLRKLHDRADELASNLGTDSSKRRELIEINLQILALDARDWQTQTALNSLVAAELVEGRAALASLEISRAVEISDYLGAKFEGNEAVSEFSSDVMLRQRNRARAAEYLAAAQNIVENIASFPESDDSLATQREVAAMHIEALRSIDQGLRIDASHAGLESLAEEVVESFQARFNYYLSEKRDDLLLVYKNALESSEISGLGVPALGSEFERKMSSAKKVSRRFPTPTF